MGAEVGGKPRSVVTVEEIEHLLGLLAGVLSARVVVNDWGAIEEIHILAGPERSPKQIVRDVESSLAAKWNLNVDHKKISVAQLTGIREPLPYVRLKLLNLEVSTDTVRGSLKAKVVLGRSDDDSMTYEGTAEGASSASTSLKIFSRAVVAALSQACGPQNLLALEDIGIVRVGERDIAVAILVAITPRGNEEVLVGAVCVRRDPADAAVRATLDAVNRRLPKLIAASGRAFLQKAPYRRESDDLRQESQGVAHDKREVAATKDHDG